MKSKIYRMTIAIIVLCFTAEVSAAGFLIVGSRALGMGGAQVAVVDDATAVYWNPAAIAYYDETKINFPLLVQIAERNDLTDILDDINEIVGDSELNDPAIYLNSAKINQLLETFRKLDESGTGLVARGNTGLTVSWDNFAFGILELGYLSGWVAMDLDRIALAGPQQPNSIANNQSELTALGFESRELIISYATKKDQVLVGGNAKYIYGRSYYKNVSVASVDNDVDEDLEEMSESNFAFDMGLLYLPPETKWRTGLVLRNVNGPSFSYQDGEIELEPQARAGVAYELDENFLIACDLDLTENDTLTPGYDSRTVGAGIEKKVLAGKLALRGGLYRNIAESSADLVFTGGLGVDTKRFKFDIGAGIGSDEFALSIGLSGIF